MGTNWESDVYLQSSRCERHERLYFFQSSEMAESPYFTPKCESNILECIVIEKHCTMFAASRMGQEYDEDARPPPSAWPLPQEVCGHQLQSMCD